MDTVITPAAAVVDVRERLFGSVLSVDGEALVAAGQHVAFVQALYPVSVAEAVAGLLANLTAVADLRYEGQVLTFMEHVNKVTTATRGFRGQTAKLLALDVMPEMSVALVDVQRAVGTHQTPRFGSGYRDLTRVILVLAGWLALGDEAFTAEQLALLHAVAAFWFAVLDFDWRW